MGQSLVLGHGSKLALAGVAIGLVAEFILARLTNRLLFGVSPIDPVTFGMVSVLLTVLALAACYVPARRATKIDPVVALRFDEGPDECHVVQRADPLFE